MKVKFFIAFWLLFFSIAAKATEVRVFFSPKGGCQDAIEEEINQAKKYIHVAVYAFTNRFLARALIKAAKRGVEVKVVLDEKFDSENEYSKGDYLKRNGIQVKKIKAWAKKGLRIIEGLMHHKFAVIDDKIVITGSYNWTATAEFANYENLLIFEDALELAKAYEDEFERLWK